jgi:RNA polymerase sigma-70 factor (sigma-E family)
VTHRWVVAVPRARSDAEARAAFESFAAARWTRLVRTAVLLGAEPHAAEDAVQATLARCFFSWSRIVAARDPDAYVNRILLNVLRASWRRRWHVERPHARLPEGSTTDQTAAVDASRDLIAALRRLPKHQREVVVLRYYADFSEQQTADALGVSVGTVKSRASRALLALASSSTLTPSARESK